MIMKETYSRVGINIFDTNLTEQESDVIHDKLTSEHMDWFLNDSTVGDYSKEHEFDHKKENESDSIQFVHDIYSDDEVQSNLFQELGIIPMKSGLPFSSIFRIKANLLTPKGDSDKENHIHKDADNKFFTILYYVNDSDGNTIIHDRNGKRHEVTPKKGRMVIFDSDLEHRSSSPSNGVRVVLNFILGKPPVHNAGKQKPKKK